MKKMILLLGSVALLGGIVLIGVSFFLGFIVKTGVNSFGPKITQSSVTLEGAYISPVRGIGTLTGQRQQSRGMGFGTRLLSGRGPRSARPSVAFGRSHSDRGDRR